MTLIDGDRIITAQLYDDEHEEFIDKKMSIIDYINAYTDEGVTTADDVLDKIRAEIEERKKNSGGEPNRELAFNVCLKIIDKYREEKEEPHGRTNQ